MVRGKQSSSFIRQGQLNKEVVGGNASAASAVSVLPAKVAAKGGSKMPAQGVAKKKPTQSKDKKECPHPPVQWACKSCKKSRVPCSHTPPKVIKCELCNKCPHGRRKKQCKDCGGSSVCEHGKRKSTCKECGGSSMCCHARQLHTCPICNAVCSHLKKIGKCEICMKQCEEISILCQHGHHEKRCPTCRKEKTMCEHGKRHYKCKLCGGKGYCEHGRLKNYCWQCGGKSICLHGRQIHRCPACRKICRHGIKSYQCECCVWFCNREVLPPLKNREVTTDDEHKNAELPWLSASSTSPGRISESCSSSCSSSSSESSSQHTSESISWDSTLVFSENKGNHDEYDVFGNAPCSPTYQWLTQGLQSSGLQSSGLQSFEQQSFEQQSFEQQSFEQRSSGLQSFEQQSSDFLDDWADVGWKSYDENDGNLL